MKSLTIHIAAILVISACKSGADNSAQTNENLNEAAKNSAIKEIAGLEIPERTFEVIASAASKIDLPNGGSIEFPEHLFVDKNGKEVTGKVDISWKEFHSFTDIMLSGIPMKYDSVGVEYDFVSGGMFTIKASQKGEELDVKKGKEYTVNLASTDDTPCYNFYELNEETGDWAYQSTNVGTPIKSEKKRENKPAVKKEKAPLLIDCEVKYDQFEELKGKDIIAWEAIEELNLDQKRRVKEYVSLLTLQKDEAGYFLDFKRKNIPSVIRVEPYYLEQAVANSSKMKQELKEDFAAVKTYFQDVANGKVMRTVNLAGFGTFNHDVRYRMGETQTFYAAFDYGEKLRNPELVNLFYMCFDDNVMVKCSPEEQKDFFFVPKKRNGLIAIAPNNEVYIMKTSGFAEIAKNRGRVNYTLVLEPTGVIAKSGDDITKLVNELF